MSCLDAASRLRGSRRNVSSSAFSGEENGFESVFTSNASTPSFDNILAACNPALLILLVIEIELTLFEQSA